MYKTRTYTNITNENRRKIQELLNDNSNISIMGIAEELEIEYSTIYREIKRGTNADGYYDADYAQKKYDEGHKRKGRPKRQLDKNTELYKYLKQKIVDEKRVRVRLLLRLRRIVLNLMIRYHLNLNYIG